MYLSFEGMPLDLLSKCVCYPALVAVCADIKSADAIHTWIRERYPSRDKVDIITAAVGNYIVVAIQLTGSDTDVEQADNR